jgi:pyruvate dehydrogenase E1 component beta subunit
VCSEEEIDEIDAAAVAAVEKTLATVMAAPTTPAEELDRDLYADRPNATSGAPASGGSEQEMTFREALNLALDQALAADDRVFLLGEDIADPGSFGVTRGLSTKHGTDRVLDTPISEAAIVGAAIGASMEGYLPVAEIMIMDFIGIAVDQIVNHAAKIRFMSGGRTTAPITVRTQVYGGLGSGATHAQSLEAWFMHVPGLKVIVPSTPRDAKGLMTAAIFDPDPCIVVETIRLQSQRGMVPTDPSFSIPLGQADVKRAGSDVSLICYGRGVLEALAAAAALDADGVSAEVIDLRTLVPLDVETMVESVRRTKRAVVVHDAVQFAGPGAEIAAVLQRELFDELVAPVERVGARSVPNPAPAMLEAQVYPNVDRITSAVKRTLERGTTRLAGG